LLGQELQRCDFDDGEAQISSGEPLAAPERQLPRFGTLKVSYLSEHSTVVVR
jgi:hypothetical protein